MRARPPGGAAQRCLALVPCVGTVDALDRGSAGDARRGCRVTAAPAVARLRSRAAGNGDAAFQLAGRRVLGEPRRAVDEHAGCFRHRRARSSSFYYRDTRAGRATLTASAPGTTQAVRELNVVAGAVAQHRGDARAAREIRARGETTFTAALTDAFGNVVSASVTWSVTPASLGTLVRRAGGCSHLPGRSHARNRDGDRDGERRRARRLRVRHRTARRRSVSVP